MDNDDIVEILEMRGHNFLWIGNDLWMWDLPHELEAQKILSDQASGDVLCVGYGMGIIQGYLLKNTNVKSFRTMERYQCVIYANLVKYKRSINGEVVMCDFFKFSTNAKYDYVIGDICADIMPAFLGEYKKFKARSEELLKPGGKFICWGDDYFEYLIEKEKP